jgi:hypothetical protein
MSAATAASASTVNMCGYPPSGAAMAAPAKGAGLRLRLPGL